ncbi:MAG: 2,3-bisphosphoglycerate-independent phosphoglycerate mutase [Gammaproteobacteria bacterium]|nr:2,3-bisphosphoglycerate-independent phosphoglycerate mutase [Gammaproteobacteria bacterium]
MAVVKHPLLLIVLDGWGYSENRTYNAIRMAHTPQWDKLWDECPHQLIRCSGLAVGLPDEQMGNSEVGHMHLGAGRRIYQDFTRISEAIKSGEFFENPTITSALSRLPSDHSLHIMGLLSPGGVHSHETHILALVELATRYRISRVYIHAFLDGRDTPPASALASIEWLEQGCIKLGAGRITSIIGRYFAMDRNKNWDRIEHAYRLLIDGAASYVAPSAAVGLEQAYTRGETDEFVNATAIRVGKEPPLRVEDGDLLVFANFRADRARQLTTAITSTEFREFERKRIPRLTDFIAMTDYGAQYTVPVAFPTVDIKETFGELVARKGLRQLRIAETEKYAHVTFFFNGGEEQPFAGEDRILVESPRVATYDLKPEMSAAKVTDRLIAAITDRAYDVIICNFANADMVGHTGDFTATVKCIEVLDHCLGRIRAACSEFGTEILLTSDHGNAEQMRAASEDNLESAEPHTAHTSNLVPLIYCGRSAALVGDGCLSDVAPTMLELLGLSQPTEMTGRSLVRLQTDTYSWTPDGLDTRKTR